MKIFYGIVVTVLILAAAVIVYAVSPPALEAVERPDSANFGRETVAWGEHPAVIGNCIDCHMAEG